MKKLIIPALAIAFAFASSAFTAKRGTSSFYLYTQSTFTQSQVQDISNYVAADNSCSDGDNVCGVQLTTAHTDGTTPVASEFNAEKGNLWLSQENSTPEDSNISMQE
jgi:hypothetical protein